MRLYKIITTQGKTSVLGFRDWNMNYLFHRNYNLPAETSPYYEITFWYLHGQLIIK